MDRNVNKRRAVRIPLSKSERLVLEKKKKQEKKQKEKERKLRLHKEAVFRRREEKKKATALKNILKTGKLEQEQTINIREIDLQECVMVRIDAKTVIYAKPGQDPDEVKKRYIKKHQIPLEPHRKKRKKTLHVPKGRPIPVLLARMQELIALCENSTCKPKIDLAKWELRVLSGLEEKQEGVHFNRSYVSYP